MTRPKYPEKIYDTSKEHIIFNYRVKLSSVVNSDEVYEWATDYKITCVLISDYWYFIKEDDRLQFILRFE